MRRIIAIGLALAALTLRFAWAEPLDDLKGDLEREAVRLAVAPAIAAEIAQALGETFDRSEAMAAGADAPTHRGLFVGPRRAWIVLAERRRLAEAEQAYAAYRASGVNVALLSLRDGGYELAIWPRPVGQARRALKRWRRSGATSGAAPRLSSGSGYLARLTPPPPK